MKKLLALIMVLAMVAGIAVASPAKAVSAADDEVYTFSFTCHEPQTSAIGQYIENYCDTIEEKTEGRIKFNRYYSGTLFSIIDAPDAVINGSADFCWTSPAAYAGRFPHLDVFTIPFMGISSGPMGSQICWELYQTSEDMQADLSQFHVVTLHMNGSIPITSTKKIESTADFEGLRIRTPANVAVMTWAEKLGMVPMQFPTTDTYENMSKNVCDATLGDWQQVDAQKLFEVADYYLDCNCYFNLGMILMNKDKYDSLPDDLKEIFDEYSGEYASKKGGENWYNSDSTIKEAGAAAGADIYLASDDVRALMSEAAADAQSEWIAAMEADGNHGQAMYDLVVEKVIEYAPEYLDMAPEGYYDMVPFKVLD